MRRTTKTRLQKLALAKIQENPDLSYNAAYAEIVLKHQTHIIPPTCDMVSAIEGLIYVWKQNSSPNGENTVQRAMMAEDNSHFLEHFLREVDSFKRKIKKIEKVENEPED